MDDTPVTQKQVAAAAGVSRSTVTRALRDDPRISAQERQRIQRIAQQMGYRPNPMINALMAQVRSGRPAAYRATLGWIAPDWAPATWERERGQFHREAAKRAHQLGYGMDVFFPSAATQSMPALLRMLKARGVQGLILDLNARDNVYAQADFSDMVAVTIGFRTDAPALHFVSTDYFAAAWLLGLNLAMTAATQRPAFVIDARHSPRSQLRMIGGFHVFQREKLPDKDRLPVLQVEEFSPAALAAWLAQHKPDFVLGSDAGIGKWLRDAGSALPFAAVECTPAQARQGISGMVLAPQALADAAVDMVTAHLIRNETGVPAIQRGILLEPSFHAGNLSG